MTRLWISISSALFDVADAISVARHAFVERADRLVLDIHRHAEDASWMLRLLGRTIRGCSCVSNDPAHCVTDWSRPLGVPCPCACHWSGGSQ